MNHPFRRSLIAVAAMSAGALVLAALEIVLTGRATHLYLVWNLFLAALPLGFALLSETLLRDDGGWRRAWIPTALWLLFLPNSPYILTDFIHLSYTNHRLLWEALLLMVWFSGAGLFLGLVSLRILHEAVAKRCSARVGWVFVGVVSLLAGLGVSLGRFERWNSWDAIHAPFQIFTDIARGLTPGGAPRIRLILPWTLGAFFGLAYLTLWAAHADGAATSRTESGRDPDPGADQSGIPSAGGSGRKNDSTKLNA